MNSGKSLDEHTLPPGTVRSSIEVHAEPWDADANFISAGGSGILASFATRAIGCTQARGGASSAKYPADLIRPRLGQMPLLQGLIPHAKRTASSCPNGSLHQDRSAFCYGPHGSHCRGGPPLSWVLPLWARQEPRAWPGHIYPASPRYLVRIHSSSPLHYDPHPLVAVIISPSQQALELRCSATTPTRLCFLLLALRPIFFSASHLVA